MSNITRTLFQASPGSCAISFWHLLCLRVLCPFGLTNPSQVPSSHHSLLSSPAFSLTALFCSTCSCCYWLIFTSYNLSFEYILSFENICVFKIICICFIIFNRLLHNLLYCYGVLGVDYSTQSWVNYCGIHKLMSQEQGSFAASSILPN